MEPRSWTRPSAPVLAPPDAFLHLRLRVTDAWLADGGEWRALADLSTVELWSILGYLRWYAPALMASEVDAGAFAQPDAYLASRPLVGAIEAELVGRRAIAEGDALGCLRAVGAAPWELAAPRRGRSR
jgi:hypothetical protein